MQCHWKVISTIIPRVLFILIKIWF